MFQSRLAALEVVGRRPNTVGPFIMLSRRPTKRGQQRESPGVVNELEIAIHVPAYPGVGGLLGTPDKLGQFLVADPFFHLDKYCPLAFPHGAVGTLRGVKRIDALLRESANGGRIGLVAGEAGIGKSTLINEFARRCGSRARVLWGACDRLVTPRALGPLHDIGRQLGGQLAALLRAAAPQEQIFSAFLDDLSGPSSRLPTVLVVEDAHWGDEATLDWLSFLGRRIDRLSALLIITYRDDEVGPGHPLRGVLAALPSALVRRVPLEPLSRECVERAGASRGPAPRIGVPDGRRESVAGHRAPQGRERSRARCGAGSHLRPDPGPAPARP